MAPRTRQTLAIATVIVALAAIAGIAAIEGWMPALFTGDTPASVASPGLRVAGTAPAESLSPGESVVSEDAGKEATRRVEERPAAPPPPATPARERERPAATPKTPKYAQAPAPRPAERSRGVCANCGVVSATSFDPREARGPWEVRVKFDDGTRGSLRFPTDPGFRTGDRVLLANGRLRRD